MDSTGIPFDRIAESYDDTRGYPDVVMNDILRVIESELPRQGLILDAGVGTGRFARPLQSRGHDVVGIDIAERMLKKAKEKGTADILMGNVCAMPFPDETFDTTISVHLLHLIEDWRCALREMVRVTRSNFVSVTSNKEKSPAQEVRRTYERLCGEFGHPISPPGLRERELQGLFRPDTVRKITVYIHSIDVQQMLDGMERRLLSVQWTVPDEIHTKAIEGLRKHFAGVVQLPEVEKISLAVWGIDRLREFAAAPNRPRIEQVVAQK